jgi:hypothetical protein
VYLRLARNGCVRFIAEELARYRQHDESMSRNSSMMLRATLAVLRQERVEAPAARGRIRLGRRDWCAWYGDQIVERLRTDWRAGRRGRSQLEAAAVLVRYCPAVALRHLARKARLVLAATAHSAVGPLVRLVSAGGRSIAP